MLLFSFLLVALFPPDPSPIPTTSRQLLLVTTPAWDATTGSLQRYKRDGATWAPVGEAIEVVIGRSGMGWGLGLHDVPADTRDPVKAEGDGRAPAGVFRLPAAFGYATSEPTGLPYVASVPSVQCVDDPRSAAYNLVLDSTAHAPGDWRSHEEMRRSDDLYQIGVIVAHNGPGVDSALVSQSSVNAETAGGAGSCIFLHVWRGPESVTAGCTAMPSAALREVLAWLDASREPVFVQLPVSEAERLRSPWGLPDARP